MPYDNGVRRYRAAHQSKKEQLVEWLAFVPVLILAGVLFAAVCFIVSIVT